MIKIRLNLIATKFKNVSVYSKYVFFQRFVIERQVCVLYTTDFYTQIITVLHWCLRKPIGICSCVRFSDLNALFEKVEEKEKKST